MEERILGNSGIRVSELCFGALPFGPLQKNVDAAECAEMLAAALKGGVSFVDTAQMYGTYQPIRMAMAITGLRPVIASKSTAADYQGMRAAVEQALDALGVDSIDIFHLHAARAGTDVLELRRGALECLKEMKAAGRIRALGISSHVVGVIRVASASPDIDIVFPLLNVAGMGIMGGTLEEMEAAVKDCAAAGKGIYLMKALAGGSLVGRYQEAIDYARSFPGSASLALGMVSREEVEKNLTLFSQAPGAPLPFPAPRPSEKRFLAVPILCTNCGTCRPACPSEAISERDGKAWIDPVKCLRCGYCVGACPQFAIRMV